MALSGAAGARVASDHSMYVGCDFRQWCGKETDSLLMLDVDGGCYTCVMHDGIAGDSERDVCQTGGWEKS